jgi:hypothetical protein
MSTELVALKPSARALHPTSVPGIGCDSQGVVDLAARRVGDGLGEILPRGIGSAVLFQAVQEFVPAMIVDPRASSSRSSMVCGANAMAASASISVPNSRAA